MRFSFARKKDSPDRRSRIAEARIADPGSQLHNHKKKIGDWGILCGPEKKIGCDGKQGEGGLFLLFDIHSGICFYDVVSLCTKVVEVVGFGLPGCRHKVNPCAEPLGQGIKLRLH